MFVVSGADKENAMPWNQNPQPIWTGLMWQWQWGDDGYGEPNKDLKTRDGGYIFFFSVKGKPFLYWEDENWAEYGE